MYDFLIYDLKVAVLITVFYMFYRLLLSKETFHQVNRVVLLLTAVTSFILPLCVITLHETVIIEAVPEVTAEYGDGMQISAPEQEYVIERKWWQTVMPILYLTGMMAVLTHTLLSMLRVILLIRRSEQHPQDDGIILCVTGNAEGCSQSQSMSTDMSPFSWMHYIVMNRGDYEAQNAAILAHERGHIRLGHSWDVLLVNLLTALQWFNPAIWMLRQDLRAIHEYEADGEVLSQGINARQYQYLLISKATGIGGYSIANGISHSTLKNRIKMMQNRKSHRCNLLKLLALLPIIGTALALNATTVKDVVYATKNTEAPSATTTTPKASQQTEAMSTAALENAVDESEKNKPVTFRVVFQPENSPIAGVPVKVIENGKIIATATTDENGELLLHAPLGSVARFTVVEYEQEVKISRELLAIDDVIIVGFGADCQKSYNTQKSVAAHGTIFDVVEQMPQFPGGTKAMMEYLYKTIRYPKEAEQKNLQGRVIVTFVVEEDGSLTGAKITRPIDSALDAEALRVVNTMPKWIPGTQNGKPVKVKYTIPITFRLDNVTPTAKGTDSTNDVVEMGHGDKGDKGVETFTDSEGHSDVKFTSPDDMLYVINGVQMPDYKIKEIKANVILNIEVLKSAEAIEKYGAQGKKGVVLITTKK